MKTDVARFLRCSFLVCILLVARPLQADVSASIGQDDVIVILHKGAKGYRVFTPRKCRDMTTPEATDGNASALPTKDVLCKAVADDSLKGNSFLKKLIPGTGGVLDASDEFTKISICGEASEEASARVIGTPANIWVFVVTDSTDPTSVDIQEAQRKTRLEEDLQTLAKLVGKLFKGQEKVGVWTKVLQYRRATITVKVTWSPDQVVTLNVITGPREHFYLTADLPVNTVSMLSYDSSTGSVTSKSAPTLFFGSINWTFGDIALERASWSLDTLSIKFLMQISSKPLDGVGVGLGYRLPALSLLGFKLNTLSLFGAAIWLKEDSSVSGTPVVVDTHYTAKLRAGLSLNLDAALDWVKQ
jgi:hypothetical protein